ncbi:hypothetical protein ACFQ3Z_29985 [Streptomyces nogalater]
MRYTQNLHDGHGFGKSWQETFEAADRAEVERYLAGMPGTAWEWKRDGGLRITQVRPATVTHPVTGTEVWFNQADQWHHAALGDETAAALARIMPEEDLPQHVTFADGSPIDPAYVLEIRDRGLAAAVDVDWRVGTSWSSTTYWWHTGAGPIRGRAASWWRCPAEIPDRTRKARLRDQGAGLSVCA